MVDVPQPSIDPSWWRSVVNAHREAQAILLSPRLAEAARDSTDELATRTLGVLATATSAMLRPAKWNEPFQPAMVLDGRRTLVPSDMDDAQRELLRRAAHLMDDTDNVSLRARVCGLWMPPA